VTGSGEEKGRDPRREGGVSRVSEKEDVTALAATPSVFIISTGDG
jgi:hypothetical protein